MRQASQGADRVRKPYVTPRLIELGEIEKLTGVAYRGADHDVERDVVSVDRRPYAS